MLYPTIISADFERIFSHFMNYRHNSTYWNKIKVKLINFNNVIVFFMIYFMIYLSKSFKSWWWTFLPIFGHNNLVFTWWQNQQSQIIELIYTNICDYNCTMVVIVLIWSYNAGLPKLFSFTTLFMVEFFREFR